VKATGEATITAILLVSQPDRWACMNKAARDGLRKVGLGYAVRRHASWGEMYASVADVQRRLAVDLNTDLWELDARLLYGADDDVEPEVDVSPITIDDLISDDAGQSAPLNLIYFGPPGTGKTYLARREALRICGITGIDDDKVATDKFQQLVKDGRIGFVTFHQSFSYEDFVEGIRPELGVSGGLTYRIKDGIFKTLCLGALGRRAPGEGDPSRLTGVRFWKCSLGRANSTEDAPIFQDCMENGRIRIGWGAGVDYSALADLVSIRKAHREAKGYKKGEKHTTSIRSIDVLRNKIAIGDLVFVSRGNSGIRAIGRVTGEYQFLGDEEEYQQARPVEWIQRYDEPIPRERLLRKPLTMLTLYELKRSNINMEALADELGHASTLRPAAAPCVLVIDEINRANVSKVLGELITLLEPDKRLGAKNEIQVSLPYSREIFGVPANLHVIGTMNTADRSLAFLDIALRRRFEFKYVGPDYTLIEKKEVGGVNLAKFLRSINRRVEFLLDPDHAIGHSYFMDIKTLDDLAAALRGKILPLLEEYFQGDVSKAALCLRCRVDENGASPNKSPIYRAAKGDTKRLLGVDDLDFEDRWVYALNPDFGTASGAALLPFFVGVRGTDGAGA
jgi:5-methylcytosine-specific restriction protein B